MAYSAFYMALPISGQEHLLICLLLARLIFFANHQNRTVSVPHDRVRDASHQGAPYSPQTSASQYYQSSTNILPYSEDSLVWSSHPEVFSRNGSPGLFNPPYLLVEQALAHLLDLLIVWLLEIEVHGVVVGGVRGILCTQDEDHVQLGGGLIGKIHCGTGSQGGLFRAVCGQED